LLRDVTFLPVSVVWWSDGRWFQVSFTPEGGGATEASRQGGLADDELLRIATSLAPP